MYVTIFVFTVCLRHIIRSEIMDLQGMQFLKWSFLFKIFAKLSFVSLLLLPHLCERNFYFLGVFLQRFLSAWNTKPQCLLKLYSMAALRNNPSFKNLDSTRGKQPLPFPISKIYFYFQTLLLLSH